MNKNTNIFFSFICDALWQKNESLPSDLTEAEAADVFVLAEQQTVSGLLSESLIRNNVRIPKRYIAKTLGIQQMIMQNSDVVNKGVILLNQLFKELDVRYVVVKGQVVATYYPMPLLRQAGDIDYYCNSLNFDKSIKVIKDVWGIEAEKENSHYHVHYKYNGVIYEGHFKLALLYNKRKDLYWQQVLDHDQGNTVDIDGTKISTLSPTLHVFYVFIHLYNHLIALGVGLRQFCDMAVMLHYGKDEVNMSELRKHLHELGLEKAYRACGSILVDYLHLPEEDLGYALNDSDREYGKKILGVVFYRGNMGHYNKRGGFRGWTHKLEAIFIKISHFIKFMPLAPGFSCDWLWYEARRNI